MYFKAKTSFKDVWCVATGGYCYNTYFRIFIYRFVSNQSSEISKEIVNHHSNMEQTLVVDHVGN